MSESVPPVHPVRVVLAGHCVPDAYMLKNAVERFLPAASVVSVNTTADLDRELVDADIVLVNRLIDGYFEHSIGQVLIRALWERAPHAAFILISNVPEAQQDAEAAGAMPGFGKSELYSAKAQQCLIAAAARSARRES
ncbi:MAG: hypothetical protein AB7G11_11505 [Phycisphaerales bacterium]